MARRFLSPIVSWKRCGKDNFYRRILTNGKATYRTLYLVSVLNPDPLLFGPLLSVFYIYTRNLAVWIRTRISRIRSTDLLNNWIWFHFEEFCKWFFFCCSFFNGESMLAAPFRNKILKALIFQSTWLSCPTVLRIRIRDQVPFWPPEPGSVMGRKSASWSGIRDEQPGSYFLELRNHFWGLKYLNSLMRIRDQGSGMETVRIRDSGLKKGGSGINIPDPQHCCPKVFGEIFPVFITVLCVACGGGAGREPHWRGAAGRGFPTRWFFGRKTQKGPINFFFFLRFGVL